MIPDLVVGAVAIIAVVSAITFALLILYALSDWAIREMVGRTHIDLAREHGELYDQELDRIAFHPTHRRQALQGLVDRYSA